MASKLISMLERLPKFTRSFYFIFGVVFLGWMLFFDSNDFYSQYKLSAKKTALEIQKEYYLQNIQLVNKDRDELLSNVALLEKFARERYLMKKDTEDLYVVVHQEN